MRISILMDSFSSLELVSGQQRAMVPRDCRYRRLSALAEGVKLLLYFLDRRGY
jgi:hypothetical protein